MFSERTNKDQQSTQTSKEIFEASPQFYRTNHYESVLASLALLLGPETEYHVRVRATRRLARQGPRLLSFFLSTLNTHPEITTPAWPWWPPQYEHCSRLLIQLSQSTQLRLEAVLQHPAVSQPVGPVLWTTVIEAAALLPHAGYEALLCKGLRSPWVSSRYAAAMALAKVSGKVPLLTTTLDTLHICQGQNETIQVRLAASYALLRNNDPSAIEVFMELLGAHAPEEARKASAFVLATEQPGQLTSMQRDRLIQLLLAALQDQNSEISAHAAHALCSIALPSTLPALCLLLELPKPQAQIAALTALEEMAGRKVMRGAILHNTLPTHVVPLLRSKTAEVRRQASYTLAAFGGEYATAVLGTTLLNHEHPGHIEAIEGLRLLHGVLRAPRRTNVVRWLLCAMQQAEEEVQVTALDSLAYLTWQARKQGRKKAHADISREIWQDGKAFQLLTVSSSWVRQRTIELLSLLENPPQTLHTWLIQLLHADNDSGVRACIAYTLGQMSARWAIPDLLQTLLDSDEHVAATALNTLGQLTNSDDAIVVYVVKELARGDAANEEGLNCLAQSAQALLKIWLKAEEKKTRDVLHSSP